MLEEFELKLTQESSTEGKTPHPGLMLWTDAFGQLKPMVGSEEYLKRQEKHALEEARALATPEGQRWLANNPWYSSVVR